MRATSPLHVSGALKTRGWALGLALGLTLAVGGAPPAPAAPSPDDRLITEIYNVSDLLHRRPDFPAPRLGLGGVEPIDLDEREVASSWTMEELVELIQKALDEDLEISGAKIHALGSNLVISLPARSQERVSTIVQGLRTSGRAAFTIEARFLDVDDATIAELGLSPLRSSRRAKSRRLPAEQGEALIAFLEERSGIELICAPRLSLFAKQRTHFVVVDQSAYVDRFEVGPSGEATEPVVEVMNTGLTFEARVLPRREKPGVILDWDVKVAQAIAAGADAAAESATGKIPLEEPELRVPEVLTISREGRNVLGEGDYLLLRGIPHPEGDREGRQTLFLLRCDPLEQGVPAGEREEGSSNPQGTRPGDRSEEE